MLIVAIAWMFVVALFAAAEALSPQGSLLGAAFTLVGWGVLPLSVVLYILATPARKARLRRQQALADDAHGRGHAAAAPVAAEREEA